MKKTIFAVLTVLLLSFILSGCGGLCEVCGEVPCICKAASKSNLSAAAKTALTALGENPNTFPTPQGTTFDKFEGGSGGIVIVWIDANQSMFDYYVSAWASRAITSVFDNSSFTANASIEFFSTAGNVAGVSYDANSIVFIGTNN